MKRLFAVLLVMSCIMLTVVISGEDIALAQNKQKGDPIGQKFGDTIRMTCHASSSLKSNGKLTYSAKNAFDGDLSTAWVEGARGSGTGESITVESNVPVLLYGFSIYAGYGKSDDIFYKNERVKQLSLYVDGAWVQYFELNDVQRWQECTLEESVVGSDFEFIIEDVYYGDKYEDTCISEIYLDID